MTDFVPTSEPPKRWRFGKVVLDERGGLSVAGAPVRLEFGSLKILLALLRHAGEVVTKDELLQAAWPGRVVAENSLAKAISRLRHALGEDAEAIRAVYGYGYRLHAKVQEQSIQAAETPQVRALDGLRAGSALPHRPHWNVVRPLASNATSEGMLATGPGGELRAIKFAIGEAGLRSLRREVALSRYLAATLPGGAGLVPLLGWNLGAPPFFVETPYYPEGSLRDWVERGGGLNMLPAAARVAMCAQVCDVVAALHGAGVIHRDLKPENLYLMDDAQAACGWRLCLGDLGAGEAAQAPELAELGLTRSRVGGTADIASQGAALLYLAPETIAGEAASQASDVYALGVLLYQMLAGDLRRPLAPGWEADIADPLLRQDIALAAATRPENRLVDARGLAHRLRSLDMRRQALEEGARQRAAAQRLVVVERRRRIVLAALALALVLLGGVTALYLYAARAWHEAERSTVEKQAVVDFFATHVLGRVDPYFANRSDISLLDAIDAAAALIDDNFADQPSVALTLHEIIGDIYTESSRYESGVSHYRAALGYHEGLGRGSDARSAALLGEICSAQISLGRYAQATDACLRARAILLESGGETATIDLEMGAMRYEQGRCEEALEPLTTLRDRDAEEGMASLADSAGYFLAVCLRELGRTQEAEREFVRTIGLRRVRHGAQSLRLAWALTDYAVLLIESMPVASARLIEAQALLDEARGIFALKLEPTSLDRYQADYALAALHMARGEWDAAQVLLQPVLENERFWLGEDHPWIWETQNDLALVQAHLGMRDAAEDMLRQVMERVEPRLSDYGSRASHFVLRWIDAALALGDEALAARLIALQEEQLQALGASHPRARVLACQREVLGHDRTDRQPRPPLLQGGRECGSER